MPPLSFQRKLAYATLLATTATVLLLGALEVALRLAGYGHSPHFARRERRSTGETLWRDNRWCTAPFFSPELVRRPQAFRLPEKKPPGTYRIFVLGSSAAMGDPEASFAFGRMLETMLRAAYPEQRFEVVNAAITAINSHVLRGLAEDCAALEPDLFIVFEGNNEVIGPFGPAGVFAPFLTSQPLIRSTIGLKSTRTGQWVAALGRRLARRESPTDWHGLQLFLEHRLAGDDPRLAAVRTHFAANLRAIAAAARRAGATTLLCTVPVNERDFAPFASLHRPGLATADLARWQTHFAAAEAATRKGDPAGAEAAYRAALAIDDAPAELHFRLGRLALQQGRDSEAQASLRQALDRDTLRFRTDSGLNAAIRTVAATGSPRLQLVDLAERLAARSAHGVTGDEFLYEHVHLTFRGAYAVAQELWPAVTADLAQRRPGLVATAAPPDEATVRRRLGYTHHDQAMIALEMKSRFQAAPFTGQSDCAQRLQTWEQHSARALALLERPDALPSLRSLYREALAATPDDWILARNAGMMLVGRGAPEEALPLLTRACDWIDDDADTLLALARTQRALGQSAAAEATVARARQLEPRHPGLPRLNAP